MKSRKSAPVNFVPKGWGYESWIVNKEKYCGKLLFFKKGRKCSWHYHEIKDETFYVHKGKLLVIYSMGDEMPDIDIYDNNFEQFNYGNTNQHGVVVLEEGDTFHVPPGMRHQIIGLMDTEMFEFSTEHADEDSYRVIKGD